MNKITDNKIWIFLLAPAAAFLIILLLSGQSFIFSLVFILIYCLFGFALFDNKVGLLLLLFFRPCLDYFTEQTFHFGDLNINFAGIFASLTILFSVLVIFKNSEQIEKFPLAKSWFLFFLALALSLISSYDRRVGEIELIRLLSTVLIFYTSFILIKDSKDLARLIKTIILSAIIPSIVAVYQYFTETGLTVPLEGVYNRVFGTFAHPNLLAFYLLLVLSLCFVIFLTSDKKKISIILYSSLAILFLATLVFTYTRSAWIGLLILVILLGITRYRKFLLISLIVLTIGYFSISQISTRLQSFTNKDPGTSIQWRIQLYKDSYSYLKQRPAFGYGIGTSNEIILKNRGAEAGSSDAHNDFLRIALDAGLIGLLAFLFLIFSLLTKLFKLYRQQNKPRLKTLTFVVFIIAGGFYAISAGDNILANTALQWAFWSLLGATFSVQRSILRR
jgi:O-antigen ligase